MDEVTTGAAAPPEPERGFVYGDCCMPVYAWRHDAAGDWLSVCGPLGRPSARRRRWRIAIASLPESLRGALTLASCDAAAPAATHLRVGKRNLLVIVAEAGNGYAVDLSHEARRAARIASYAHRLEEGINALPEAFVLYDDKDRLLVSNPQYIALYPSITDRVRPGVTFDEISRAAVERGQFRFDCSSEEWLGRRLAFHRRAEGYFEQQLDCGRWIQVSERRTASGGTTSIRSDITLLKQQQQELRRAIDLAESGSRAMSRFLAVLSHEVRNGLNGMLGMAQLLAHDAASDEQAEKARLVLESTRGLMTVLSDLLDYLKNEARGVSINPQSIAPRQMVHAVRTEHETAARERSLSILVEVDPAVPAWVAGDPARIQQVLTNLVSNAVKYSSHGRITIGVSVVDAGLRYQVRDEGIGIPESDLEQLFELFARVGRSDERSTGLGLAISKQLVVAMGGRIGVDSEPGRGSRFWFDLPIKVLDEPAPAPTQAVVPDAPRRRRLRVGVVDDDPLNLYVAEQMLRRLGHEVFVFRDGEALLRHGEQRALNALLLDVMMPGVSGSKIASRLRMEGGSSGRSMGIVAATGSVLPENLHDFLEAGFDAVLQKPIHIDKLDRILQQVTARHALGSRGDSRDDPVAWSHRPGETVREVDLEPSAAEQPFRVLERLRADIGRRRFVESVTAACTLYRRLLDMLRSRPPQADLRPMLHQVAGNASQLGFLRLGFLAGELERAVVAGGSLPTASDSVVGELSERLRAALGTMGQMVEDRDAGKSTRVGRQRH